MSNLRLVKGMLGLVIAAFVGATVYISILTMQRHAALEQVSRYNVAWLVSQAASEYTRLEQRISAFGLPSSKVTADEVRLRFDIMYNRLTLLGSGEAEQFIYSDSEHRAAHAALEKALDAAQPYIDNLKPEDVPKLLQILLPVDPLLARLAAAANRAGGDRVADDRRQLMRLHWSFSAMAGGLALCGIVLIGLLTWHNHLLGKAHANLRDLTSDLKITSDNLESAHREVQAANSELEKQNQALVRRDRELQTQNERFEAALGNMSQALCLVDARQCLVICNQRYQELFGLHKHLLKPGTSMRHLAEFLAADDHGFMHQIYANQQPLIQEGRSGTYFEELPDGRTIGVSHRPLSEGGWIATYEDLTERRRAEARIAHMAHHDALTDLPNRTLFHQRLVEALAGIGENGSCAVMCLDLDRFKTVNDTLGHPVGDVVLKGVTERLLRGVRPGDLVARLGGDEFAIILRDARSPQLRDIAEQIVGSIAVPFEIDGQSISIGTSVGITMAPDDGTSPDKLLKNADLALYHAKSRGRGSFRFFEAGMDSEVQDRRQMELDLRAALEAGEFHVVYQPQVNLATNRITGCEALLRWSHPLRGPVSPAEFIPIAEEAGLIPAIGEWVLRQACLDAVKWPVDTKVAVNLSPAQFRNSNLAHTILVALAASGLHPSRLELEITESLLLQDDALTLDALHQMRALGVNIALDDFGTGYSSLSYLRRFPFDKIKIDQTFVREMAADSDCMSIIQSIVDMARSLRMKTTGEGVETEDQKQLLERAGCIDAQGFYFHHPMSQAALLPLISRDAERHAAA